MYFMKASLDHRPMSIIIKTGQPPMNIAMAAPDRIEWVPTSDVLIFRTSSPITLIASCNAHVICFDVTSLLRPRKYTVDIGVSSLVSL